MLALCRMWSETNMEETECSEVRKQHKQVLLDKMHCNTKYEFSKTTLPRTVFHSYPLCHCANIFLKPCMILSFLMVKVWTAAGLVEGGVTSPTNRSNLETQQIKIFHGRDKVSLQLRHAECLMKLSRSCCSQLMFQVTSEIFTLKSYRISCSTII